MLVVSDTDDVFLPKPTDLLVNLTEARASLEALLGRINDMFVENHNVGSAMGPALQAGFKLMVSVPLMIPHFHGVTDHVSQGPNRWSNHGLIGHIANHWPRGSQKPRRSQDFGYFKSMRLFCHVCKSLVTYNVLQESNLLQAASPFYKTFAIECSRAQVSVDMFLFSSAYQDVASLGR
jgi:protein transport protein SEC24